MPSYKLEEGWDVNPLIGKYSNKQCVCGSKMKVKFCCGKYRYVKNYLAQMFREAMKMGASTEAIKIAADRELRAEPQ